RMEFAHRVTGSLPLKVSGAGRRNQAAPREIGRSGSISAASRRRHDSCRACGPMIDANAGRGPTSDAQKEIGENDKRGGNATARIFMPQEVCRRA
ncbi:hypothetical protein, partial [Burkholderia glumae]|uniref:hypothetical protein n=1 Tax=Burkholderia glumae TaxID=337 RepID=UPI001E470B0B